MTSFLGQVTNSLFRRIAVLVILAATLICLSCGDDEISPKLTSIGIVPQNVTVAGTPTIVYTAIGHYGNKGGTKDISTQVQWQSTAPSIVAFSDPSHPNYLLPTGSGCGTNLGIVAAIYSNPSNPSSGTAVVGNAGISVECGTSGGADFSLSSIPTSVSATAGSIATYTINVAANPGKSPIIALQVTGGLPAGATANFSPRTITGSGTSTLTITTSASTNVNLYHLRISGADLSGSLVLDVDLNIT